MTFQVVREDGKFVVRDSEGVRYGTYDSRQEAEDAAEGWKNYYEAPLI